MVAIEPEDWKIFWVRANPISNAIIQTRMHSTQKSKLKSFLFADSTIDDEAQVTKIANSGAFCYGVVTGK